MPWEPFLGNPCLSMGTVQFSCSPVGVWGMEHAHNGQGFTLPLFLELSHFYFFIFHLSVLPIHLHVYRVYAVPLRGQEPWEWSEMVGNCHMDAGDLTWTLCEVSWCSNHQAVSSVGDWF